MPLILRPKKLELAELRPLYIALKAFDAARANAVFLKNRALVACSLLVVLRTSAAKRPAELHASLRQLLHVCPFQTDQLHHERVVPSRGSVQTTSTPKSITGVLVVIHTGN